MKNFGVILIFLLLCCRFATAQEDLTIVAPTSEAAEGLDLTAVSELFKEAKTLEEFEKSLNDPDTGVNNLDLDADGNVDFIRVVDQAADDTHIIILQVPLAENEFQDVATIEVEKSDDEQYNMQVRGSEVIYGRDYYVAPAHVHVRVWPIFSWMYRPVYRPYRSAFYFGYYPRWWRPYRPVTVGVYRTRTVHYRTRASFSVTRTSRVRTVNRASYKPRTSTLVKKKTTVTRTTGVKGKQKVTRTTATRKTTAVKKGKKTKSTTKVRKTTATKRGKGKKAAPKKAKKTRVRKRKS